MTALSVDIWLMIIDEFDTDTLWSTIRNVSQYLRDCVDEFFRRSILRETVVNLIYSTIHSAPEPPYRCIYLPMQISHFSSDGTQAVFRQVRYKHHNPNESYSVDGSVRGWIPFVERYCRETKKPAPTVSNKSKSMPGPPIWQRRYPTKRSRAQHAAELRKHTSIGRGDRPPHFILIDKHVHDTELVDLKIDCANSTISFNWRCTLSAFFKEAHFVALAVQHPRNFRIHDVALTALEKDKTGSRRTSGCYRPRRTPYSEAWREARRKRLEGWVKKNKKRMSLEHRLITEGYVSHGRDLTMRQFHVSDMDYSSHLKSRVLQKRFRVSDLLIELHDVDVDTEEIVPESCASDCRDLMMWPRTRSQRKEAEYVQPPTIYRQPCIVM
ncbi:hypothetical protein DE146DRAFT_755217 [Phaeosphaeria sp. MPI-PUGE-AT-0046c]|nr:hypothetical protein DE146DRAFT_755217 [Phaeosphaeria sp. MPI-PUGE-AT-0046c]